MGKVARREKRSRVEKAKPFLNLDQYDTYKSNGYIYVNRWHGGKQEWEVCEYTEESFAREQAWRTNQDLDNQLKQKIIYD